MLNLTKQQLFDADFSLFGGNPVLRPFDGSFVTADPSLLTPDNSPDGLRHLFCHTNFGVWHLKSEDGISFKKQKKLAGSAMRPNINLINGVYYLYYEATRSPAANLLTLAGLARWRSEIRVITSTDLMTWSAPRTVVAHTRDFEADDRGVSISNPFLLEENGTFRLYYSCGLTFIPDCGFSEPTYINCAESGAPDRDFVSSPAPILSPDPGSEFFNLCCGCLKVYKLLDGYAGIQNGIYDKGGKNHSAITLLFSDDGIHFEFAKPLVEPDGIDKSWMSEFVYASHLVEYNGTLRLYFNARDYANPIRGREGIGFCEAKLPGAAKK